MKSIPVRDASGLELPPPDAPAIAHSVLLIERIAARIEQSGGAIGFDEYMQFVLYEPGLGYYSAGATKFGADGDFVTAPEVSPLFGACLARQIAALVEQGCEPEVLEFGAGSGKLCGRIMNALPSLRHYRILDLGAELAQRQRDYLGERLGPERFARIEWLDRLPPRFDGIVIANEVLDAMPVHLLEKRGDWRELGIGFADDRFQWVHRAPAPAPLAAVREIEDRQGELPQGYRCEVNLNYRPWFASLAQSCGRAAVIIVDYGYEQDEYYHPARSLGTLNCHYRHRLHYDPLVFPGLQDVTAFVDFDACADAAEAAGFAAVGLVTQRDFLLANGLLEAAREEAEHRAVEEQLAISQQIKTLTLPEEMGDKFKVLALQKGLDLDMPAMQRRSARG